MYEKTKFTWLEKLCCWFFHFFIIFPIHSFMLLLCCTWWSSVECSIDRTKQNTNWTWKRVTTNKNSFKCSKQPKPSDVTTKWPTRRFFSCSWLSIHMQHKTIWLSNSIGKRKNCYLQIFTKISFHVLIKMSWRVFHTEWIHSTYTNPHHHHHPYPLCFGNCIFVLIFFQCSHSCIRWGRVRRWFICALAL